MKLRLQLFFAFVFCAMITVTGWASFCESIFSSKILNDPWGVATMFDTYFGFLTFYLWVYYKERSKLARGLWLIAILLLGNMAMAAYALWQISRVQGAFSVKKILLRSDQLNLEPSSDA